MTAQHPEDADHLDYDEPELDAILNRAMGGILAKLDAGFNTSAGLADVYARCRAATANAPSSAAQNPEHEQESTPTVSGVRLQEICDQIDMLNACLTAVIGSAQANPFAGAAFLEASRPTLARLRMGLANRSLSKNDAERLVDSVQSSLDQADHILRTQHASTLERVVRTLVGGLAEFGGTLAEQLHTLREMIARLYADAGYANSLAPIP